MFSETGSWDKSKCKFHWKKHLKSALEYQPWFCIHRLFLLKLKRLGKKKTQKKVKRSEISRWIIAIGTERLVGLTVLRILPAGCQNRKNERHSAYMYWQCSSTHMHTKKVMMIISWKDCDLSRLCRAHREQSEFIWSLWVNRHWIGFGCNEKKMKGTAIRLKWWSSIQKRILATESNGGTFTRASHPPETRGKQLRGNLNRSTLCAACECICTTRVTYFIV